MIIKLIWKQIFPSKQCVHIGQAGIIQQSILQESQVQIKREDSIQSKDPKHVEYMIFTGSFNNRPLINNSKYQYKPFSKGHGIFFHFPSSDSFPRQFFFNILVQKVKFKRPHKVNILFKRSVNFSLTCFSGKLHSMQNKTLTKVF